MKIGAWVLQEACRTAMAWPEDFHIAVNVSPVQFEADGFVESVQSALRGTGLAPHRLELELTESVLLTEDDIVVTRMRALREIGVRLSLDDFGTGYSSLNYLRKYPFTKVKIDQSFIREPFADENAHRIVTAVAGLGSAMGTPSNPRGWGAGQVPLGRRSTPRRNREGSDPERRPTPQRPPGRPSETTPLRYAASCNGLNGLCST